MSDEDAAISAAGESAVRGQQVIYDELDEYVQNLVLGAGPERERKWSRDFSSEAAYLTSVEVNRRHFVDQLGGFPSESLPLDPTLEPLFEARDCIAFTVSIAAFPGVRAHGILLIPKDSPLPAPAIIVQHGMGGSPEHAIGITEPDGIYKSFGRRLAARGYVIFSHAVVNDLYRRSRLHRKAVLVGKTTIGIELWKIMKVVDYLAMLPEVMPDRIGFYGISQGGLTALHAGAVEQRLAATVSAAYFNLRAPKLVVSDDRYTALIDTIGTDKFIHNLLTEFSDWDIASLICPRPLFFEAGRRDDSVYWKMLEEEYAKVEEVYERLGILERLGLDLHDGGHEINAEGSFPFLDRWLKGNSANRAE